MKSYKIFQNNQPELNLSIIEWLSKEHKEVYYTNLDSLAITRKLRPIFLRKKPKNFQINWLVKTLKIKTSEKNVNSIIQLWLLKDNIKMIIEFLDGLGIKHDEEGIVEDIPDKLDKKKLKETVDKLLTKYPSERLRIYLYAFQSQKQSGWDDITNLQNSNPKLSFKVDNKVDDQNKNSSKSSEKNLTASKIVDKGKTKSMNNTSSKDSETTKVAKNKANTKLAAKTKPKSKAKLKPKPKPKVKDK